MGETKQSQMKLGMFSKARKTKQSAVLKMHRLEETQALVVISGFM
jgi:hypothetical protein